MAIKVGVAAPLRQYCNRQRELQLDGATVKEVLSAMSSQYPLLYEKLCEEDGTLRKYVNLFVNGADIKRKEGLDTALADGNSLNIIPAVAGGLRF